MNGYHRKYTLHCEALSPIHIGSGEALSRWEYVVINNELYYVTDEFWELLLSSDSGAFDKLVSRINQSNSASLTEEFDRLPNKAGLKQTLKKSEIEFRPLLDKNRRPIIRNINRFAGTPNYYIPGSSLKGAFRGAYEVSLITENKIQIAQASTEDQRRNLLKEIEQEFLDMSNLDSVISGTFRKIRVPDIKIKSSDLMIIPISYTKNTTKQNTIEFYECLKPATQFKVSLTDINKDNLLQQILIKNVFPFYRSVFDKLKRQSDDHTTYLENFYDEASKKIKNTRDGKTTVSPIIRCGYGAGQLSNSILMAWQNNIEDDTLLWQGKAKQLLREEKMQVGDQYPSAPKWDLEGESPLGWIKINKMTESINQ